MCFTNDVSIQSETYSKVFVDSITISTSP